MARDAPHDELVYATYREERDLQGMHWRWKQWVEETFPSDMRLFRKKLQGVGRLEMLCCNHTAAREGRALLQKLLVETRIAEAKPLRILQSERHRLLAVDEKGNSEADMTRRFGLVPGDAFAKLVTPVGGSPMHVSFVPCRLWMRLAGLRSRLLYQI